MKPQDPRAEAAAASPVWPGLEKSPSKRRHHIAWVVLTISLAASTVGWFISLKLQDQASAQLLGTEAASVRAVLQERLAVYENVLHGACGLFAASVSVERKEWRAYLDRVAIEDRFPGINALGFMACVRRPDLERFVQEARADGMPDFEVHPAGNGEELFVVKYLEAAGAATADHRFRYDLGPGTARCGRGLPGFRPGDHLLLDEAGGTGWRGGGGRVPHAVARLPSGSDHGHRRAAPGQL